jgi:hypothetical protein
MSEKEYTLLLINIGYVILFARFIIVLVCLLNYKWVLKYKAHLFILLYAVFALLISLSELLFIYMATYHVKPLMPYLIKYEIDDTFFISPFYYLNEILFYGLAYSYAINGKGKQNTTLLGFTILLFITEIINSIWGEGYKDSQPIGSFIFSAFNIVISFMYLKNIFITDIRMNYMRDSFSIISIGILIPSLLSILIYVLTKDLFNSNPILYYKISIFRMTLEILCFLIVAYGISLVRNKR